MAYFIHSPADGLGLSTFTGEGMAMSLRKRSSKASMRAMSFWLVSAVAALNAWTASRTRVSGAGAGVGSGACSMGSATSGSPSSASERTAITTASLYAGRWVVDAPVRSTRRWTLVRRPLRVSMVEPPGTSLNSMDTPPTMPSSARARISSPVCVLLTRNVA